MEYISTVAFEEVVAAFQRDTPEARSVLAQSQPFTRWRFTAEEIGDVGAQCHDESYQRPIRDMIDKWIEATAHDAESSDQITRRRGRRDRAGFDVFACYLYIRGTFRRPPIVRTKRKDLGDLGPEKLVLDGAHRMIATFELHRLGQLKSGFALEVLWGKASR